MRYFFIAFILLSCSKPEVERITGQTMGTTYSVSFIGEKDLDRAKLYQTIQENLYFIDKIEMSTWAQTSSLSKFNNSPQLDFVDLSKELHFVISTAIDISRKTDGAFDVTVMPLVNAWGFGWKGRPKTIVSDHVIDSIKPFIGYEKIILEDGKIKKRHPNLQVDLSAIAKGYAVDVISEVLNDYDIDRYLVEIGGEVRSKGLNDADIPWRIGIDKPSLDMMQTKDFEEIIAISDWSIATSGDYRNFYIRDGKRISHTINPKTFRPVEHELGSVTIIAKTCIEADALATACMVLGVEKGLKLIERLENVEAMFIERFDEDQYKTSYSSGFEAFIYKTK